MAWTKTDAFHQEYVVSNQDRVLRSWFWVDSKIAGLCPEAKLKYLELVSRADRDGIVEIKLSSLGVTKMLCDIGELCVWRVGEGERFFAWIPRFSSDQPSSGAMKVARNPDLPAPPKAKVMDVLNIRRGYAGSVTEQAAKQACPRAWGISKGAGVASTSGDVQHVFEEWRKLQKRPNACKLSPATRDNIRGGLRNASAGQLVNLIRYAYKADEPGPRWWRGDNPNGRTYLGLDNLFVAKKIESRLQMVEAWLDRQGPTAQSTDGTDLGPMAAYRARRPSPNGVASGRSPNAMVSNTQAPQAPAGTKTSPNPRPKRLNAQCRKMLLLFQQRGDRGVRTSELAGIALKYSARVSELRGHGYAIVCAERASDGNNLYVMKTGSKGVENVD